MTRSPRDDVSKTFDTATGSNCRYGNSSVGKEINYLKVSVGIHLFTSFTLGTLESFKSYFIGIFGTSIRRDFLFSFM